MRASTPLHVRARPGFEEPLDFRRRIGRHRNRGSDGEREAPERQKRLLHLFRDARLRDHFNREAETFGTAGFRGRKRHEMRFDQFVIGKIGPKRIEGRTVAVELRCRKVRRETNASAPVLGGSSGEKRFAGGSHQALHAMKARFPVRHRGMLPEGRTFASSSVGVAKRTERFG